MDKGSLAHMANRFRDSEKRTEILRIEVAEAIRQASREGMPQKDICEATGYTRQQVRRIVKAEGEHDVGAA
ncbi:helix-turn-helix domain-containing protein [Streptomonospora nanhaiensis]|uniref:helix-turn-helix domain-containing protein n=1 Tax=Streptomonospora nanhaiensis TaxID=1323731 RepID=UPI001C37F0ED|nr:helix-turn-helix domain-containing protein [Streptomonospora nanhaiensis]MBV2366951.1 helix-turn-helix domain-containing protein [Streptomonospora nanhaiensis]